MDNINTIEAKSKELESAESPKLSAIYDANDFDNIIKAGEIIRNGELVSFPTETVYGLGANALDAEAATKIFTTKERPMTDPLIVHIYEKSDAYELISENDSIIEVFNLLADTFWPGPFTCVMKANPEKISPVITADTGYVGVRCPNHPIALKLIKEANRPICAPSANKFGHVSPTKAEHVLSDFKNNTVFILDGGQCDFGIESTVVKIYKTSQIQSSEGEYHENSDDGLEHIKLLILRRGGISEKALEKAITGYKFANDKIVLSIESINKKHFTEESHKMEAPGQFLRHYAPNLPSYMISFEKTEDEGKEVNLTNCVVLDFHAQNVNLKDKVSLYLDLSERGDYAEAINNVYDYLRISETQENGDMVLIANLSTDLTTDEADDSSHSEHRSALFDRLFRAVTGQCIKFDPTMTRYVIDKL